MNKLEKLNDIDIIIQKLDEKIEELINNEGETLASEGYSIDIGWNWSEHTNI